MHDLVRVNFYFDFVRLRWYLNDDWQVTLDINNNDEVKFYGKFRDKKFGGVDYLREPTLFPKFVEEFNQGALCLS